MSESDILLERAARAIAEGKTSEAVALADKAVGLCRTHEARFDALLHRARAEYADMKVQKALDTYWEARNVTKRHRLGRAGEADLGIGMTYLDLGRDGEGLECVRRASRQFRKLGQPFLRGCAETVLADEALRSGDLELAERHLKVATDLLETSPEPRILSGTMTLRAEVLARQGKSAAAEALLKRAERIAGQLKNPVVEAELRGRRREVREILAGSEDE